MAAASAVSTRVIGLDLGERRIGVSMSDTARSLATPHSVITRHGPKADYPAIAAIVAELGAGLVVVGLPLTLAGAEGAAAAAASAEASALATELCVAVVMHDERLTTVEAERRRREPGPGQAPGRGGRSRFRSRSGGGSSRVRRTPVDAAAATVLLQSWLDQNRGGR